MHAFLFVRILFYSFLLASIHKVVRILLFQSYHVVIYPSHLIISSLTTKPFIILSLPFTCLPLLWLLIFYIPFLFSSFLPYFLHCSLFVSLPLYNFPLLSRDLILPDFCHILSHQFNLCFSSLLFPRPLHIPTFISSFTTIHSVRLSPLYSISIDISPSISSTSIQSLHFSILLFTLLQRKNCQSKFCDIVNASIHSILTVPCVPIRTYLVHLLAIKWCNIDDELWR